MHSDPLGRGLWVVAILAACDSKRTTPEPTHPVSPASSRAELVPALPASAVAPPPALSAEPAGPPPNRPDPQTFACGAGRCTAGKETCCPNGPTPACVTAPAAPPGSDIWARYPIECRQPQPESGAYFNRFDRCDESQDCGEHGVCCFERADYLGTARCLPRGALGPSPCPGDELCLVGGPPCLTPGAECRDGLCKKPFGTLRCGQQKCSGADAICCGDPPVCGAPAARRRLAVLQVPARDHQPAPREISGQTGSAPKRVAAPVPITALRRGIWRLRGL